jgi:hypothetical protein
MPRPEIYARAEMTRRGSLAAIAAAAAVIAVWAAASGTSSSRAVANAGVQSLAVSILLPVLGASLIAVVVSVVIGMMSQARAESEEESRARGSRFIRGALAFAAIALFAMGIWLIYATRHPHRQFSGAALGAGMHVRQHILSKPVPLNGGAFGSTSAVLVALVLLFLFRHRLRVLLHGRGSALSPLGLAESRADEPALGAPSTGPSSAAAPIPDPRSESDPRRAVLLCYQHFVRHMTRRGWPRDEAETPFEYCHRLAGRGIEAGTPVADATSSLTSLFSSARYGFEPVTPDDRRAAIDWLTTIAHSTDEDRHRDREDVHR